MAKPNRINQGGLAKERVLSEGSAGDAPTPDRRIGQIAHADNARKTQGGAGAPQSSPIEPEEQGGIAGP
jgi:hypothetical protein